MKGTQNNVKENKLIKRKKNLNSEMNDEIFKKENLCMK